MELGYWIAEPFWGQDSRSRRAARCVSHAFRQVQPARCRLGLLRARSRAGVSWRNFASDMRGPCDALSDAGESEDVLMFAILRPDWVAEEPGAGA